MSREEEYAGEKKKCLKHATGTSMHLPFRNWKISCRQSNGSRFIFRKRLDSVGRGATCDTVIAAIITTDESAIASRSMRPIEENMHRAVGYRRILWTDAVYPYRGTGTNVSAGIIYSARRQSRATKQTRDDLFFFFFGSCTPAAVPDRLNFVVKTTDAPGSFPRHQKF